MTHAAFVRFGHGYETGSRGRCEAFDGFEIIAAPLSGDDNAGRASRVFPGRNGSPGVTYASHEIKLARWADGRGRELYILMHHGGGREVLSLPSFYDGGALEAHILSLPERLQYALLYTIWSTAANARREAQIETAEHWATAFREKRIKTRRKGGRARVEIVHPSMIARKSSIAPVEFFR